MGNDHIFFLFKQFDWTAYPFRHNCLFRRAPPLSLLLWLTVKLRIASLSVPLMGMWPISSTYLGWNPDRYLYMCSMSLASRSSGAHPSPGRSIANVLQLKDLLWSQTHAYEYHCRNPPPWLLTSVLHAFHSATPYHHPTGCIHSYVSHCAIWLLTLFLMSSQSPHQKGLLGEPV